MVRAKFTVEEIKPTQDGVSISLTPVVSGSAENEEFFKFTPWGKIEIGTVNQAAAAQFEVGAAFYVDFTPANP